MITVYGDLKIKHPASMSWEEILPIMQEEVKLRAHKGWTTDKINIEIDNDHVIIKAWGSGSIQRVRRITGYLSNINNFNDSKIAELDSRVDHMSYDQLAIR